MKALIITLLFGRDELLKQFATLLKQRSAVHKLRKHGAWLEAEAKLIAGQQADNTVDQAAAIKSHNATRAALTKSFDL